MFTLSAVIDPNDMLLFVVVARNHSFTGAAKEVGVTRQAVSQRIAKLEEDLGVRLLERTTRSMRLTDAGARYLEECRVIADRVREANATARDFQSEPVGHLRLSVPVLFGRTVLNDIIEQYLRAHPRMTVEVVLADRRVNLVEEGFDLAVRVGELDDSTMIARRIGQGHVRVVGSPELLERLGPVTVDRLAELPCVGTRRREVWAVGRRDVEVDPIYVLNDVELVCDAAIRGLGLCWVPSFVYEPAMRDGRLVALFADEPAQTPSIYAVYPSRHYLPAKVRAFIELLEEAGAP